MKNPHLKKTLLGLGVITAGIVGALYFSGDKPQKKESQTSSINIITPANGAASADAKMGVHPLGEQFIGKKDAHVTIVEYASFSCPLCANFHTAVFPHLKKDYVDTGKVKFIYRDYPLDNASLAISMITRCVARDKGNDKFFPIIKILYETQKKWSSSEDMKTEIVKITKLAGYGESKFDSCLADKTIQQGVISMKDHASQKLGVRGTPTLFINGEFYQGDGTLKSIRKQIDDLLKK